MIIDLPAQATSSVELFLLRPEHVGEAYVSWLNDPEVNQYLESRYVEHTVASTREFVEAMLAAPDTLFLGIRSRATGAHVGNIKLGPISARHGTGEVGILVGDRCEWGKGLATAAIVALSAIARDPLGLRKVTAGCYASNEGSRRAFLKAGYELEGRRRGQMLLNGQPEDLIIMGHLLT